MATYYSKRRREAVGNRFIEIDLRLARKYQPVHLRAADAKPAPTVDALPGNGTGGPPPVMGTPLPPQGVAAARSHRIVRAFACDDGAPIHLMYGRGAPDRPARPRASLAASRATEVLPPFFESFADPASPAPPATVPAANGGSPTQGRAEPRSESGNGTATMVPPAPPASGPPTVSETPAGMLAPAPGASPAPPGAPAGSTQGGDPSSAAPDWSALDRRAQESAPAAPDDPFLDDLQSLLAEAGRRAAKGQEVPSLSPAPSSPANAPGAVQPAVSAPTAASPAATESPGSSESGSRHEVFEQLSQQLQRATTFDLGTVQVDKTFAQIEAALDTRTRQQEEMRRAQQAPRQIPSSPLEPIERVEDMALITDPARARVSDGIPPSAVGAPPDAQVVPSGPPLAPSAGGRVIPETALEVGDLVLVSTRTTPSWLLTFGPSAPGCVAHLYVGNGQVVTATADAIAPQPLADVVAGAAMALSLRRPNLTDDQTRRLIASASQQSGGSSGAVVVHLPAVQLDRAGFCEGKSADEQERCLRWRGQVNLGTPTNDRFVCSVALLLAFAEAGAPLTSAAVTLDPERLVDLELTGALAYVGHLAFAS